MVAENRDILTDTYLLLWFARLYGLHSFKPVKTETGKKVLQYEKWRYWVFIFFQATFCIYGYFIVTDYSKYAIQVTNDPLLFILNMMSEFNIVGSNTVLCSCYIIYSKGNREFWQELYEMESELRKLGIELNHKLIGIISTVFITFTVALTYLVNIVIGISGYRKDPNIRIIDYLANHSFYHYACIIYNCSISRYIVSLVIIGNMFSTLAKTTEDKFLNGGEVNRYSRKDLWKIAQYHQKVCEVARLGNKAMSLQVLILFLGIFTTLTVISFKSTVSLLNNAYGVNDLLSMPWVAVGLITLMTVIFFAHNCEQKVSYI